MTTRAGKPSVHASEDYLLTLTFKYIFLGQKGGHPQLLKEKEVSTRKVLMLVRPSDTSLGRAGSSTGQAMHLPFGNRLPGLTIIL